MKVQQRLHWMKPGAIAALVGLAVVSLPGMAHQVQLADDVGGTLHIEPNDNPRAGEASLMWFALTQRGGTVIPLEDCDCNLQIFADANHADSAPLAEPPLKPVSAEGYDAIPGTEFAFPTVGAYTLVLTGQPTGTTAFTPFELTYTVTVATGVAPLAADDSPAPAESELPDPPATAQPGLSRPWAMLVLFGGVAIAGLVLVGWQRRM